MSTVFYLGNRNNISTGEKVRRILRALGGLERLVKPGCLVLIKPNFVAPFPHAVTNFEILKAIVEEVKHCGGRPVIGESSGFEFDTETTFKILGAYEFAQRNQVELVNFDTCEFTNIKLQNGLIKEVKIPKLLQQADVLINVPKIKRHSLTKVTIGIKNLFGLLARESRRKIHALGLERGISELARVIKSDLVIVDGSIVTERAVYGAKRPLGLLIGGTDVYAVDMHCCQLMQVNYRFVGHIRLALEAGLAQEDYHVIPLSQWDVERDFYPAADYQKDSISKKLHTLSYQLMYLSDIPYAWICRGKSLVPKVHFYLGIRPKLDPHKCTDCRDCVSICPVNAIQIPQRRIDHSLCSQVRCLKCIDICPFNAIQIKGRRLLST
jgi:uncharacterized protein (DUF362 family)/NAD-dependent dihydropyrimidine dehydrogenase PreA subunit